MKKNLWLYICSIFLIIIFVGCSTRSNSTDEVSPATLDASPDNPVVTLSANSSQENDDSYDKEYVFASKLESFSIEKNNVTVKLEYDESTNTFLGTVENQNEQSINDLVIEIEYRSGLSVTKKIYTEIIPGENKIACLGSYVDPSQWRIEFSFGEGGSLRVSGENSNIEIKHVGDIIPDDGLVVDGFRYASKSQNYFFENDVIKLSANFIGSRNWFKVYIENKTDKDLEGIDFGVKMLGAKRTDWTMNMTVRADIPRMMKVYSFEQIFKLWKPVLINTTTGIDMVTDDNGDLEVFNPSSPIANKTEVSNSKDEIVSDWPELIPIDIPHFNSGEMKIYTNFEDEKTVRVTLSFRKIELNYMKDYTEEIRAAGFDEFVKSDSEEYVIREYHRGDETLYLNYSIEYDDLKYAYTKRR